MKNIEITKSIVKIKISKGEVFSEDNLTVKRPGNGLSPMIWDHIIGKRQKEIFIQMKLFNYEFKKNLHHYWNKS